MKTKLLTYITVLVSIFCTSCSKKESFTNINLLSNTANLVVSNETTGVSTSSKALALDVKNGDEIMIKYTPKENYSKYSWKVVFDVFDATTTVTQSLYSIKTLVQDMPIGIYKIRCSASITDADVVFTGIDGGYITINVIK